MSGDNGAKIIGELTSATKDGRIRWSISDMPGTYITAKGGWSASLLTRGAPSLQVRNEYGTTVLSFRDTRVLGELGGVDLDLLELVEAVIASQDHTVFIDMVIESLGENR